MKSRNCVANARLVLAVAAATIGGQVLLPTAASAAPAGYATEVLADSPYLYFRLNETGTLTNAPAADLGTRANVADGIYRGNPVGGAAGVGTSSDGAVSFPGVSNNPAPPVPASALDYVRTTNALDFGTRVGQSSYEVVFKTNTVNPTNYQSIFGVFNQSDNTVTPPRTNQGAVAIEFNSTATGNATVGTSRFYVRDEDNRALGALFDTGPLLDGNWHHLAFTFDYTAADTTNLVKAYVDGVLVPVTIVQQGIGLPTAGSANFLSFTRDPIFGARNVRGTVGNEADVTIDEAVLYGSVLSADRILSHAIAAGLAPAPGLIGDTNDDGVVDLADLNNVLNNFGGTGTSPGDDNGDGVVDLADLNNVLNNFGNTSAASPLSAVPEPAAVSLLAVGAVAAMARRRRA